ncbi:magnesium-translocating P-type ATPase [Enterobacterales bacterium CwR94]|nr:magnesium-translocating P-type ATPase [Enterobacterales bacterium CwR94]
MTQMTDSVTLKRDSKPRAPQNWPIAREAQMSTAATLTTLNTSQDGLSQQQAEDRLLQFGRNQVAQEKAPAALIQLLLAFKNPFIFVLMGLAAISVMTDVVLPMRAGEEPDLTGVIIMLVMILLSGLLRFWQEFRTNKTADALKSLVQTRVRVRRRLQVAAPGEINNVEQSLLVPGDIIELHAGDVVPADIKLLDARELMVSQASLTGESLPVEKWVIQQASASREPLTESQLLSQPNICLMGTCIMSGSARAVVVATGSTSYFGTLANDIVGKQPPTSFDKGVNSVSWLLIRFMAVMVPIVLILNGFTKGDWMDATLFALAVAVGLTPEMLPMIVSTNLAKGAMALARRKVVVKRMNAIQNLGAMDVLCTDKTGTLTQDHIVLEHVVDANGVNTDWALQLAWLNSYHQNGINNLMDRAVVNFCRERPAIINVRDYRKLDELAFDFNRRRLSVAVSDPFGKHMLITKGAVEEMLEVATHIERDGSVMPLDDAARTALLAQTARYHEQGYRVLLVGWRNLSSHGWHQRLDLDDERDLIIAGMLTFLDPAKESAAAAIAALRDNGVQVKVLTGDNPLISSKICRDVGLDGGSALLGSEMDALNDDELRERIEMHTLFAKLTPSQKDRIVTLLQQNGRTVGFLGDGINDAAALRSADVGISVDSATDIAKASADIILLEKSLMVLEQGVITGRQTFGNIIKYLNITASSNFGNVFSVLVASAFIPFMPMLAIQLLLQNLIYDLSQMALPWDKMDKEFVRKPRKWDAKNIGRFMLFMGPTSSIFDITTFALMWYVFAANTPEMQTLFQSGWFIEGLLSQTLVVHMLRTQKIPFIQSRPTWPIMLTTLLVVIIGIGLPFSPLASWFSLQPLPMSYFPWLIATLTAYCLLSQGMKTLYIRKFGQWF